MNREFAAINIGDAYLTAVAVRWNKNGDYTIDGFSRVPSDGFSMGTVSDMTEAIRTVGKAIKKLGNSGIREIYAGISSVSLEAMAGSGSLLISKHGHEILDRDIRKCVEIASTIRIPLDREPLHRIIQDFIVDGEVGIKNPLNLEAVKLESQINILTIKSSAVRNVHNCISDAGFVPAGFIFSGLAASYRILSEEDMQKGSMLLNIRKDISEVMVFNGGVLSGCRVFPVGGKDIIVNENEIDQGALQKLYDKVRDVPGSDNVRRIFVTAESDVPDKTIEAIEDVFGLPAKNGICAVRPFEKLPQERIGYIGTLGIIDHLYNERKKYNRSDSIMKRAGHVVTTFLDRYF
ncbi:MAG: hypothetical protein P9L90_07370 [Candidatus Aadella gelida]|nr:hypothetical protein [Candidatus Aadella gelida]